MTHLLAGPSISTISGILHLFPSFAIHSPESLVLPPSPPPAQSSTKDCQPAFSKLSGSGTPLPPHWALPACLLPPQRRGLPQHTPQKQLDAYGILL